MRSEQLLCKPGQGMVCALLIGALFLQSLAFAQVSTSTTDEDAPAPTVQVDPKGSDEAAESADTDDPADAAEQVTPATSTASMERFDPSEKVSEDKSVSFPVDI